MSSAKARTLALLCLAEIGAMSLWFVSAAILDEMTAEAGLSEARGAALSSAVQLGFVLGAVAFAITGIADRLDPRRVFVFSALIAAGATALLLVTPVGGNAQVALRTLTGVCLAGVYPVGMTIAVSWGTRDRGLLVGLLVGALTLGSATPHLIALLGGVDWRVTVMTAAIVAAVSACLVLATSLGPHYRRRTGASTFDPAAIKVAWTNRRVRYAYAGYLCHMWELYAFWAWCGAIATASYTLASPEAAGDAATLGRITAFVAIALGGLACVPVGIIADRHGKARTAQVVMMLSTLSGAAAALAFGGPTWLMATVLVLWGITVIPDSAQFSALVADAAPADTVGSLMTLQTALGFALTAVTVQLTPTLAEAVGWPVTLVCMVIGPAAGIEAMRRLIRLDSANARAH